MPSGDELYETPQRDRECASCDAEWMFGDELSDSDKYWQAVD